MWRVKVSLKVDQGVKLAGFFTSGSFFVPFSFEVSSGDGKLTWSCC
jgi:hypothetical protein